MKCNKCGFENNDNAKFCSWCGEKFEALEEKNDENKCNVCGNVNKKDAKFCAVCGSQLSPKVLNEENKCYICGNVNANDAKYCGISVDGVIGNAGNTSGLICLSAIATASFPDNRSLFAILLHPFHCDCTEWTLVNTRTT